MTSASVRPARRRAALLAVGLALVLAACGATGATPAAPATPAATPVVSPSVIATGTPAPTPPEPTAVPGGVNVTPAPLPSDVTTTETDWGTILDAVPGTFPVYPGAKAADWPGGPVSAAWTVTAGVDKVATWYRDALEALGYGTAGLSDALEDGSRVLDSTADIPECRIQTAFHPAGESTIITVLYAAGCAGGEG